MRSLSDVFQANAMGRAPSPQSDMQMLAARFSEAVQRLDYLTVTDHLLSPDVVWVFGWGERVEGRAAIRSRFALMARRAPIIYNRTLDLFFQTSGFARRCNVQRRLVDRPVRLDTESLWTYTVEGGLIVKGEDFLQRARLLELNADVVLEEAEGQDGLAMLREISK
jgi:hypothetical protein